VLFAQVGSLTDRLISLLVASGQPPDPKQKAELKKIQALAWGTKFEGPLMRDTLFILSPGNTEEPPLAQHSLALSDADTFLVYSSSLPPTLDFSDASMTAVRTMVPGFQSLESGLAAQGLKLTDFGKAFGPEFGVLLDWGQNAAQPSTLLTMDLHDAATAKKFVTAFTAGPPGSASWTQEEKDGATVFQSPPATGLFAVAPTIAVTDRFLLLGFSQPEVLAGITHLKQGKAPIAANPAYEEATKAVGKPTSGFGYLDLKTLFERSYGTLRPLLAMSLAFSPDSAKYIDAGRLPSTEAISKHLSPAVYSQSVSADGTLVESVGPLTFNQVLGVSIGGAVAAALPTIEAAMGSGFKLDPNTLQLAPPKQVPPATPPPAPPAGPDSPAPTTSVDKPPTPAP
jgi:hypothetical protein